MSKLYFRPDWTNSAFGPGLTPDRGVVNTNGGNADVWQIIDTDAQTVTIQIPAGVQWPSTHSGLIRGWNTKPDWYPGYRLLIQHMPTSPTPPAAKTVQDLANQVFQVQQDLQTTLAGIGQSANAAANSAQTTQAAVTQSASSPNVNPQTLLIILFGAVAAYFVLKK